MDGLYDYILWQRDNAFTAVPFQEVDAVVLCLLAYCDFAPLFERAKVVHLRDCKRLIDAGEVRMQRIGKLAPFIRILEAACVSRRYGELRMSGYADIMLAENAIQFSAVTYHSDAGFCFIAYRGTDATLAGWKEDFMISFQRTQAQELALQYAENRVEPGHTWYLGGHSKGGNLALYAACMLPQAQLDALGRVFLLDGPGFCPEAVDPCVMNRIEGRATRIIPGCSVIGRLFEPQVADTRIVQSSNHALLQHNPASWGIDHGRLALLAQTDPLSDLIKAILDKWIGDTPCDARAIFIDDLFATLAAGGAETLEELDDQGYAGYDAMLKRLRSSSEITLRILKSLPRQAIQTLVNALLHRS